jgi:hypothetical protein
MIKFTDDEMNEVFSFVNEHVNWMNKNKYVKITLESITNDGEVDKLLLPLVDYQVKVKIEGDHSNDGQMVDYGFYFKNPEGKVTEVWTEMCLMCGWNHCDEEEIK